MPEDDPQFEILELGGCVFVLDVVTEVEPLLLVEPAAVEREDVPAGPQCVAQGELGDADLLPQFAAKRVEFRFVGVDAAAWRDPKHGTVGGIGDLLEQDSLVLVDQQAAHSHPEIPQMLESIKQLAEANTKAKEIAILLSQTESDQASREAHTQKLDQIEKALQLQRDERKQDTQQVLMMLRQIAEGSSTQEVVQQQLIQRDLQRHE